MREDGTTIASRASRRAEQNSAAQRLQTRALEVMRGQSESRSERRRRRRLAAGRRVFTAAGRRPSAGEEQRREPGIGQESAGLEPAGRRRISARRRGTGFRRARFAGRRREPLVRPGQDGLTGLPSFSAYALRRDSRATYLVIGPPIASPAFHPR